MAKVIIAFEEEDWDLLRETLEMDAESSMFDQDLRGDISDALDRYEYYEPQLFLFLRDNHAVENETVDENGKEVNHWLIYWDRAEYGKCPVCAEDYPEDSDENKCSYCGFDADKHDGDYQEAIRCAKIAMEKNKKETK